MYILRPKRMHFYRTRVRSLGMLVTNWLTDSLTHWLTHSRLVNLIDVALACEDANSKLVEVVTVAHVDAEDHVGNSLLQIWELTFGPKAKLLFGLWAQSWSRFWSWSSGKILNLEVCSSFCRWCFVPQTLSTRVGQDFEVGSSARFWNWSLFSILSLMFCRGYEVESWSIFWS